MPNPNPSPATRFGAGTSGNPQGKTSKQKRAEMANAEKAVAIRGKLLDAITETVVDMGPEALLEYLLNAHTLRLIKDSEDRGLGAPVQPITAPDAIMPSVIELVAGDLSTGALAEIMDAVDAKRKQD